MSEMMKSGKAKCLPLCMILLLRKGGCVERCDVEKDGWMDECMHASIDG